MAIPICRSQILPVYSLTPAQFSHALLKNEVPSTWWTELQAFQSQRKSGRKPHTPEDKDDAYH